MALFPSEDTWYDEVSIETTSFNSNTITNPVSDKNITVTDNNVEEKVVWVDAPKFNPPAEGWWTGGPGPAAGGPGPSGWAGPSFKSLKPSPVSRPPSTPSRRITHKVYLANSPLGLPAIALDPLVLGIPPGSSYIPAGTKLPEGYGFAMLIGGSR